MKKIVLSTIASLALLPGIALAQEAEPSYGLPFTGISHSPVTQAMGGAGTMSASNMAWAAEGNAAAIPFADTIIDGQLSYQSWGPSKTTYLNAGVAACLRKKLGLAVSLSRGTDKPVNFVDSDGQILSDSFSPSNYRLNIGASYRFIKFMSAGVNLSYAGEKLTPDFKNSAPSVSAYVMASLLGLKASAGINNIGGSIKDALNHKFTLPSNAKLAVGYGNDFGKHRVDVEANADYYLPSGTLKIKDPVCFSLGAEYVFNHLVMVRGGYHYGGKTAVIPSYGSLGLGVNVFGAHLDLAYCLAGKNSPMNNTFNAGIGFSF